MTDAVLQTVPLGMQWPTLDPFLFCVHHDDAFPAGNDRLGPDAPLEGRPLGQDFGGIDGWNMYHGQVVPGFPGHPHRGFETVTYVRKGLIDHSDSLGAVARFGRGDVQWLTAGEGIVHSEMFPLVHRDRPNPLELFQIWLNLPEADKLVEPHFAMLWGPDLPRIVRDADGRTTEITVIAGTLDGEVPPPPPPHSWAARPDTDVAIWHVRLDAGARWTMPAAGRSDVNRVLYVFEGGPVDIAGQRVDGSTGAVVDATQDIDLASAGGVVEILVLQGRPIGEPVAQYGPFVMNDRAGVQQAMEDYQRTRFGGWPFPVDDPVHPRDEGRFARHADGRIERLDAQPTR